MPSASYQCLLPHGNLDVKHKIAAEQNYQGYFIAMRQNDSEIGSWILRIRDFLAGVKHGDRGGLKEFAKECGVTQPNLSKFLGYTESSHPEFRTVYKILRSMLRRSPIVLKEDYISIPLVVGHIAAHPAGHIPGDAVESMISVPRAQAGGRRNLVAVRLAPDANSMEPSLHPGDIVIIDRDDKTITPRGVYAVRLPEDPEACTVKRLQTISGQEAVLLLSDNTAHEPHMVPWSEHLIVGRVIWSWTSWIKEK